MKIRAPTLQIWRHGYSILFTGGLKQSVRTCVAMKILEEEEESFV
ncbi:hypothetical protein OROHE_016483 [Orobanche hederae]